MKVCLTAAFILSVVGIVAAVALVQPPGLESPDRPKVVIIR